MTTGTRRINMHTVFTNSKNLLLIIIHSLSVPESRLTASELGYGEKKKKSTLQLD